MDCATNNPDENTLKASKGLLMLYEKDLKVVKKDLDYLVSKQICIENELKSENENFGGDKTQNIQEMMETIRAYKEKLINIKKQMTSIHQRTNNLKKRTTDLQEFKEKEQQARIAKRQHEEAMIASTTSLSRTSSAEEAIPR